MKTYPQSKGLKSTSSLKRRTVLKSKSVLKRVSPNKRPKKRLTLEEKTAQQLVKVADKVFSQYIRLRDSTTQPNGTRQGPCISCQRILTVRTETGLFIASSQNGHYVGRGNHELRYDEENNNLQCLTEESNIRLFNGKSKGIADLKVGDELWAFNEEFPNLREKAVVESVDSFLPNKLYEVEMEDGSKFWATGDHRVVSNGKWVRIDDMLHNVSAEYILEL